MGGPGQVSSCAVDLGRGLQTRGFSLSGQFARVYKEGPYPALPGTCMRIPYETPLGPRKDEEFSESDEVQLSLTL